MAMSRKHYNAIYHAIRDNLVEVGLTRAQEIDAMLSEQPPFHYSYESDFLYDSEVEAHQVGEGHWQY